MKIALTCSFNDGKYFIKPRYLEYITKTAEKFGFDILPALIPITDREDIIKKYAREFDGFVFTGGDDVEPSLYGEEKQDFCGDIQIERDTYELTLLREICSLDKPVFGICRGIQVMNVFFGGTLWQDISAQLHGNDSHTYIDKSGKPRHVVKASGFVGKIAGKDEIVTNSYHHQSVKSLGEGLKAAAVSCDGLVEAVEHDTLSYFKAVQWHPEIDPDELSFALAADFLNAVKCAYTET